VLNVCRLEETKLTTNDTLNAENKENKGLEMLSFLLELFFATKYLFVQRDVILSIFQNV